MMYICNLCPRKCGIDRDEKLGLCRMKNELAVSKASVHVFEEPVISGTRGSGTIFFAGCTIYLASSAKIMKFLKIGTLSSST